MDKFGNVHLWYLIFHRKEG